jgi:hypothetical protein
MYNIGTISFKFKKQCENYTRNLINNLGVNKKIDHNHLNYTFFCDLLKNHPEYNIKVGCGIDYFYIIQNPVNKQGLQTMIKRIDGTEEDFSWVYCCKFKKRTVIEDLKNAMREAIDIQIFNYKSKCNNLICNYCKDSNALTKYHVDHIYPFSKLYDDFLKDNLDYPKTFGNNKLNFKTCFNDTDNKFKNDWVSYHLNNATFQILCIDCNSKKSNLIKS